jgi:selenocysteine-specific elongation factor
MCPEKARKRRAMGLAEVPIVNVMVGTAGHIDHGKTELVKLLTGCDTDTLSEEKARGMSIDLGFAPCTLRDNLGVGIVDVPGHEKFIKNMVAGATGIDVLLLVVAADDGVMPQTREHLDIVDLLGINHGLVAITKTDLVDAETVELAAGEVRELLKGTALEGSPIVPVSSITGEGYDQFWNALSDAVQQAGRKNVEGPFRFPVERVFSVKGYGTVATGIPVSGRVRVDDELELFPQRTKVRVRGQQVFGRTESEGLAGQCVAIAVAGVSHEELQRGSTLATPGLFQPCAAPVAKLRLLASAPRPLRHRASVRFLTGTSQAKAITIVLGGERLNPGEEGLVQFLLEEPMVLAPGDPYVVRFASPAVTVGGGSVLRPESGRLRRKREETLVPLRRWEQALGDSEAMVEESLLLADASPVVPRDIAKLSGLSLQQVSDALAALDQDSRAVAVGGTGGARIHRSALNGVKTKMVEGLQAFHGRQPHVTGMDVAALRSEAGVRQDVAELALRELSREGTVRAEGAIVRLAAHQPQLRGGDQDLARRVEEAFKRAGFSTPRPAELAEALRVEERTVAKVIEHLLDQRVLVRLGPRLFMHREVVDEGERLLRNYIDAHGELDSYYYKSLINSTRRYALALLDHFDARGITIRHGNVRRLKT